MYRFGSHFVLPLPSPPRVRCESLRERGPCGNPACRLTAVSGPSPLRGRNEAERGAIPPGLVGQNAKDRQRTYARQPTERGRTQAGRRVDVYGVGVPDLVAGMNAACGVIRRVRSVRTILPGRALMPYYSDQAHLLLRLGS